MTPFEVPSLRQRYRAGNSVLDIRSLRREGVSARGHLGPIGARLSRRGQGIGEVVMFTASSLLLEDAYLEVVEEPVGRPV